jgi:hypothetical protein
LIIGAAVSVLDRERFSLLKERQKDVSINSIFSQMADIDAGGTDLRSIIPIDMAISGVARRGPRICLI